MNDDSLDLTVVSASSGKTDTLSLSASGTTLRDLLEFASAVLGVNGVSVTKDGRSVHEAGVATTESKTLSEAGLKHGDLVLVSSERPNANARPATSSSSGGLDFSSLLNSSATNNSSNNNTNNGSAASSGGLTFNIPALNAASASSASSSQQRPVKWDGMTLDDAIARNPRPESLVRVLFSDEHPNLLKELNHHSPLLAKKLREAGPAKAADVWREHVLESALVRSIDESSRRNKDREMESRLRSDPMDEEANRHFGDRIRRENVERSYQQMMETFPESMGRVLMLYIETEVNGKPVQAFVDSGAQSTIMSRSAAEKCDLLRLLDDRFAGVAVGVGTGTILGRVHLAPLVVKGRHFPCTITVMEDGGKGLGDKNMEFLFGLDMLKRHRCRIDLGRNVLVFGEAEDGVAMETPFLHEKDLDETKGGTKGFNADKANEELERLMMENRNKKKEKSDDDDDKNNNDAMEVDDDKKSD